MTNNEFARKISEATGIDNDKSLLVLETLSDKNVFSQKEQKNIAEEISAAIGCDTEKGEEIRYNMMQILSAEIKKQSKALLIASGAVIGTLMILKIFKNKEK